MCFVFSTTYQPAQPYSIFFRKQLMGTLIGYAIFILFCSIDYHRLQRWGYFLYGIAVLALIFTIIKGKMGLGARRWISLGIFTVQPSEIIKLLFPAFFSYYLLGTQDRTLKTFAPILGVFALTTLLVRQQPDLGTAIIIGIAGLTLLYHANIDRRFFYVLFISAGVMAPVIWKCLKPYQQQRVMVFLGSGDSQKERYQIEQAQIAIGSGGLWGKGFLQGTQNMLQFLPESRTDFIFAIIGEELGFFGTMCVVALYLILFLRMLAIIRSIQDPNAQTLALGLVIPIIASTIINIGMVLQLLPVVGIPLPFMSYGLTHSWITFASMGWFNSIAMRRSYHNAIP